MSLQNKSLRIGLFGFGIVGEALYQVLNQTPTLNAEIVKVCIKHPAKNRNAPASLFTTDARELLQDETINTIVEVIDDSEAAFYITAAALKSKKAVVSANKKMIAEHFEELISLQQQYQTQLLYESACCASIPVIRNLEEYYDNDLLSAVSGIVNGSTNYILTRIAEDEVDLQSALKQAQDLGFAETDPSLDIEGKDAVNKLTILLTHAYGIVTHPERIIHTGIQQINSGDAVYAREKGFRIRLVARAEKLANGQIAALVLPQFVQPSEQLYHVRNEFNGVTIQSGLAEQQFFYGKGAGGFPTASAVLSDLSALRYDYRYAYKKLACAERAQLTDDFYLRVYVSFPDLLHVPHGLFEIIDEWRSGDKGCYVTGTVHSSRLRSDWWKKKGVSLILLPDALSLTTGKERLKAPVYAELVAN